MNRHKISDESWNRIKDFLPPERSGKKGRPAKDNRQVIKEQHLVECFFNRMKQGREIATRYEKLASSYLAIATITALFI